MTAPVRLQLSRRKGFDLQAHSCAVNGLAAVSVARPTRWGNPIAVGKIARELAMAYDWSGCASMPLWQVYFRKGGAEAMHDAVRGMAPGIAVDLYRALIAQFRDCDAAGYREWIAPLAGRNLACWCALDAPRCHAGPLLELASEEPDK